MEPVTGLLSGIGVDAVQSEVPEHNFGVIPVGTISAPATITLTNQGPTPVMILDLYTGSIADPNVGVLP